MRFFGGTALILIILNWSIQENGRICFFFLLFFGVRVVVGKGKKKLLLLIKRGCYINAYTSCCHLVTTEMEVGMEMRNVY